MVKLVITLARHAGGRGFESCPSRHLGNRPDTLGGFFSYARPRNARSHRSPFKRGQQNQWLLISLLVSSLALAAQPTKRPSDEERGRTLYDRHCVQCHGALAMGDGPATKALIKPVPNLKGNIKADEATLKVVLRGKGTMPAFDGSFDKYDARRVLRYMATLGQAKKAKSAETVEPEAEEELPVDDVGNAPPNDEEAAPPPPTP